MREKQVQHVKRQEISISEEMSHQNENRIEKKNTHLTYCGETREHQRHRDLKNNQRNKTNCLK